MKLYPYFSTNKPDMQAKINEKNCRKVFTIIKKYSIIELGNVNQATGGGTEMTHNTKIYRDGEQFVIDRIEGTAQVLTVYLKTVNEQYDVITWYMLEETIETALHSNGYELID